MRTIRGLGKSSLWRTWKTIRQELRNMSNRDVVDFIDYDIDPDKWIGVLLRQIATGRYEPHTPYRFTLGKSNGFSRTMTQPGIPDLVLYRTLVDAIYRKALPKEHKHVYFRKAQLPAAQAKAQSSPPPRWVVGYGGLSSKSYHNWQRYAQYRKHLLLSKVHAYIVVTDITNFFDSVLHSHVEEAFRGIAVDPRLLGIVSFLLERLSIRQDYANSHGISLPVDQFDCSRTLAHLTLFRHDDEMVELVGEGNYVRWMDDQNFGVQSRAAGLRTLSTVGRSLARLHLCANAKKSKVLSLAEAKRHFHLDINSQLDKAELLTKSSMTTKSRRTLAREIRAIWSNAKQHEGIGEFDKILKRIYRLSGLAEIRHLRRRAGRDMLRSPDLSLAVLTYMRCSGSISEFLDWAENLLNDDEQIYPDINVNIFESFLRLEADPSEARRIRQLAVSVLKNGTSIPGKAECAAIAPLLLLRFGDRRSLSVLRKYF